MKGPYKECEGCLATKWCKRFSGESPKPDSPSWCNPKFRLYKALSLSNIPKRYENANQHNYKKDKSNSETFNRLKPFLDNILEEIDHGKNFAFRGTAPGTGKTFHGFMVLNHFIYKACLTSRLDFENPLAFYVNYNDLMDELRYNDDEEYISNLVDKVKNVPVLLLDDIGAGTVSGFTTEQTYMILNHRYNNNLSTVYTTNLSMKELMDRFNPRIVSRMFSNCEDFVFNSMIDRRN